MSEVLGILYQVVVFGLTILGLYFGIKQFFPQRIIFIQKSLINLNDSSIRKIEEMVITYKNEEIKEDLILLKGYIYNNSIKDIAKDQIYGKLRAVLYDGKWLNCKIGLTPSDFAISESIYDNELIFDFNLLKAKENFGFEALAISKDKKIKFKQRIQNVKDVKILDFNSLKSSVATNIAILSSIIFLLAFLSSLLSQFYFNGNNITTTTSTDNSVTFKIPIQSKNASNCTIDLPAALALEKHLDSVLTPSKKNKRQLATNDFKGL